MTMDQPSLLDLLAPEPEPPAPREDPWKLCEACGEKEIYSWIHPNASAKFGHPVCIGMELTLNHIHFAMGQSTLALNGGSYECCLDKHGIHGKKISKPTREHWLDHAHAYIERAKTKWNRHPLSLLAAVGEIRAKHSVAPDEAPVN